MQFTLKNVPATSVGLRGALICIFFGPAGDCPYWKHVVLAGVKQRTHQAELVGKKQPHLVLQDPAAAASFCKWPATFFKWPFTLKNVPATFFRGGYTRSHRVCLN